MKTIKGFKILNKAEIESDILYLLEYSTKFINQYFDNRFGVAYLKDDFLFALEHYSFNFYTGKINRNEFDKQNYIVPSCLFSNEYGMLKYNYQNTIKITEKQYYKLHFLNRSLNEGQKLFNNICDNYNPNVIKNDRIKTLPVEQLFAIEKTKEYYKIK